ncbi:DUF4139 domain-containing protein [Thalassospira sp. GO-4]|uniref:DUF4139 domain-containing protein n=1 Tax=Thalassospira sp. GO-4 TaxID=2946605 RepID=UPI002025362E|nr:DUF4139 domain-containing protein [Thalassospira sp. GO-4]URK16415.1 DUF4139 domain-containing protein [Thalassospira sp. GO-4]
MAGTLRNRFALAAMLGTAVFFGQDIEAASAQSTVEERNNLGPAIPLSTDARTKLQLTVYPGNLSLIAEQRKATIPDGQSTLRISGLPTTLIDDSFLIGTATDSDLVWTSLRNRGNGYNAFESLLHDQIGKTVTIRRGDDDLIEGKLVALTHLALVQTDAGIEQVPMDRIIINDLPDDFTTGPSIDADIATTAPLDHVSMAYLLGGIGWNTSYVAVYDSQTNQIKLSAIARVTNNSGSTIDGAQLRLVAGDMNQVGASPMGKGARTEMMMSAMADSAAPGAGAPDRETFENLHVYGPFNDLSMKNGDTVILPLIDAQILPVERRAIFQASSNPYGMGQSSQTDFVRPDLELKLTNDGGADENSPWPAGITRIFAKAPSGDTGFLAENYMSLTPVGRDAILPIGQASELSGTREVTAFSRTARPNLPDAVKADLNWTIRNTSTREETVTLRENVPSDWTVTKESHKHDRPDPGLITWTVKVPAKSEIKVSWSVESSR